MEYRSRFAEEKLRTLAKYFKVVLVTGARQVGKSTLLANVFPGIKRIEFDPVQDLHGARRDPDLFLDSFPPPLILDEVQHAPELLPALKRRVDRSDDKGQYFLSGSQNLATLRSVAESMAGRVGILRLEGISPWEVAGLAGANPWLRSYLEAPEGLMDRIAGRLPGAGPLTRLLWRGCLPGLLDFPDEVVPDFMAGYVQTCLERDIRAFGDIRDLGEFGRFLGIEAALTAQEVNDAHLGREVGVSGNTARRWRDLLVSTFQWRELPAHSGNALKRVSQRRKGHMLDTGLACYLQRLGSPDALAVSPLLGSIFESWVVSLVHQQMAGLKLPPLVRHWRSAGGAEVDMVLERDGMLYPVEVKCKTVLSGHDLRGLRAFRESCGQSRVGTALVVYAGTEAFRTDSSTIALPWDAVCA